MKVYLGADHRGFELKEKLKKFLLENKYDVEDMGNFTHDPLDDYPDFAAAVARMVALNPEGHRGIVLCGSGVGVDEVVNKFKNARSGLAINADQIAVARAEDNINVLSLAADYTNETDARNIAQLFLITPFKNEEKYLRRIQKIHQIEGQ